MDTQNDFLDNAVNDELDIGQEVDMQSQMCSYLHDDMDENCSLLQSDTCRDSLFAHEKSPISQRFLPIKGKNGCVFQFPQSKDIIGCLPQGIGFWK